MKVLARTVRGVICEVEFEGQEMIANQAFNELLDHGYSVVRSVEVIRSQFPNLDEQFYTYLAE